MFLIVQKNEKSSEEEETRRRRKWGKKFGKIGGGVFFIPFVFFLFGFSMLCNNSNTMFLP